MTDDLRYPIENPPAPGTVFEVAPGIKWLQMPLPFSLNHINLYLLEDTDGWIVVDTGIKDDQVRANWDKIFSSVLNGKPVTKVIVTHMHPDHLGNAGWICEKWGADLYMSRTEYYYARGLMAEERHEYPENALEFYHRGGLDPNLIKKIQAIGFGNYHNSTGKLPMGYRRLEDGDEMIIGGKTWRVIVGCGHSPEHACLFCPELEILLSGDQVLPRITSNVSVNPIEPEENPLKVWIESHRKFLELPEETFVLPAHNRPFYGIRPRLEYLIHHHEDRMRALEEACITPSKAADLLDVLFERELDSFQTMLALGECIAHLHCLMDRNRMNRTLHKDGAYRYESPESVVREHTKTEEHDEKDDAPMMV